MAHRNDALTLATAPTATSGRGSAGLTRAPGERTRAEHGAAALAAGSVHDLVLPDVARICGLSGMQRRPPSSLPALLDAAARTWQGSPRFEAARLLVARLGDDGLVVAALDGGRPVDATHPDDEGPFSTTRAGGLPAAAVVDLTYGGVRLGRDETRGGLLGYLGTDDLASAQRRADAGDAVASDVLDALGYQVGKALGAFATVLAGRVDGVLLLGLAAAPRALAATSAMVSWIAPIQRGES